MMRKSRRSAAYAVMTGLLAAGALAATMPAADAYVAGFCNDSGTAPSCTITKTITAPTSVTVGVTATTKVAATVASTISCTLDSTTASLTASTMSQTPAHDPLALPATAGGQCTVSAIVALATTTSANTLSVALTYTTAATPSPSPSPTNPATGRVVIGYGNKCVDDNGNSSANRAKVQIWTCDTSDKAQLWTYSSGELIHNGKCLNDQAWGGSRSKQILYTCDHALNELWTHLANGEFVLNANGGKLCLDDPAYSTKNGTQLIVYTCKDSTNQRWRQGL